MHNKNGCACSTIDVFDWAKFGVREFAVDSRWFWHALLQILFKIWELLSESRRLADDSVALNVKKNALT